MLFAIGFLLLIRFKYLIADLFKRVFGVCCIVLGGVHDLRQLLDELAEVGVQVIQLLDGIIVDGLLLCRIQHLGVICLHKDDTDTESIVQRELAISLGPVSVPSKNCVSIYLTAIAVLYFTYSLCYYYMHDIKAERLKGLSCRPLTKAVHDQLSIRRDKSAAYTYYTRISRQPRLAL